MTISIEAVSQTELTQRRHKLRQRRRARVLQTCWRILAVSGLAGGLAWATTSPAWVIQRPDQVKILGNRVLSVQKVRSSLSIDYPQSLLRLEPRTIADGLKAKLPILEEVTVNRQLFPLFSPSLTVQLKERYPVAIALPAAGSLSAAKPTSAGLLDEQGVWMPMEGYTAIEPALKLPTLKIIGNQEHYRPVWTKLYQSINRSPVKISEIDWRDPTNLILKTELGLVHLGSYSARFGDQLTALDRMRKLPNHVSFSQISYIDLRNPEAPMLQLLKTKDTAKGAVKSGTP